MVTGPIIFSSASATTAVTAMTASASETSAESAAFSASLSHDFGLQKVEDSEMRVNGYWMR
ncbi:hypothetical protein HanRHA438_Chr12g0564621 [Helianthus annuus]|nr:hypothetical protein HanRHA438_Chr12g0564621 [Helianthus annuus]